tara:strand:+ start:26361 stop:26978 length:618 start_codon:yes stop_codon:yes gene_type:complete
MSQNISAELVKEIRDKTSAPLLDCKKALEETNGDIEKAIEILKIKGLSKVDKKSSRDTSEGLIFSYIHAGGKIGVILEVNCETDFVARNNEFQDFSKEVCMQIAASAPKFVSSENIPGSFVEDEKRIIKAQVDELGKKPEVADKMVEGKLNKILEEVCLMDQVYIRDSKMKVRDLLNALIAKLGENINIARFTRYQIGEIDQNGE